MHGRIIALVLGLSLAVAPAAAAQVPGLPPIFPPGNEEPEEPEPKPEEPQNPPPQQEPKPKPQQPPSGQQPQPQPPPQQPSQQPPQPGPPPPTPTLLLQRRDVFLGQSIDISGRARPGATVALIARERWNLDIPERVATATAGPNGVYSLRYRPYGNTQLAVADGPSLSKPVDVFVAPRMDMSWIQKRGRVEALLFQMGTGLIAHRGAKVHFYGFSSRRARTGRRIATERLIVAEAKGKTIVGTFISARVRGRLRGLGYCVEWRGRFDRPDWQRACGARSMRF